MYLYASRTRRVVARAHVVKTEQLTRRVVELVVIDLDVGQSGIELHVDIALPGRKLDSRHSEA